MTTAVPAEPNVRIAGETCPRCHTTKPWGESSWCPDCGYYPAVDKNTDGSSWADDLPDVPQEFEADNRTAMESIPAWFWVMIAGIVGIGVFSVAIRVMYPEDDGPRGMIATVQLLLGVTSMTVAHVLAGIVALKSDRRLNLFDILISWFNVWQPTISGLPNKCARVWGMVWGMFGVLTAMTIIGGIDYGAPFRGHEGVDIKPMNVVGSVAAAAAAQAQQQGNPDASLGEALGDIQQQMAQAQGGMLPGGGAPKSMEDALGELGNIENDLQGMQGALNDAGGMMGGQAGGMMGGLLGGNNGPQELSEEQQKLGEMRKMEAFIYGVVTDRKNIPTAFLFAANTRGEDQHVAEIKTEDLDRDVFRKIAVRLYKETQDTPEIRTDREAVWVKPAVTCRLKFFGYTKEGEFVDPEFDAMIVSQRGLYR